MERLPPSSVEQPADAAQRSAAKAQAPPPLWPKHAARGLIPWPESRPPRHVHVVPSLSLGGAERIVADLASIWGESGTEADIVVLRQAEIEHCVEGKSVHVHRLGHMIYPERLRALATIAAAANPAAAYCHLSTLEEMQALWQAGVKTIPVVHNVARGWRQDPRQWERDEVPFVVACGDVVAADLRACGLEKTIHVIRHIVSTPRPMPAGRRLALRAAFGAAPDTLLVGMIGRIVPQKRYDRALEILRSLAARRDARLVVIGAAQGDEARRELAGLVGRAHAIGVRGRLVLPGSLAGAEAVLGSFDLFLNTSDFEGVSIASMAAIAAGVPNVLSDVGGQREIAGARLVPHGASDADWLEAIDAALAAPPATGFQSRARATVAEFWPWLATLGPGGKVGSCAADILFVTGNLDIGGAQRSLSNLVGALPDIRMAVAVCGPVGIPAFVTRACHARYFDLTGGGGLAGRMGRILALVQNLAPKTLAFWNMDAATKLAVAKVLGGGPVRVADVSPGPMLFRELEEESQIAADLSSDIRNYILSLDCFVAKYRGGLPGRDWPLRKRCHVVSNGVAARPAALPESEGPTPPRGADPALALVVVSRLTPSKKLHLLPRIAQRLRDRLPGATMTVVGALHDGSREHGWHRMIEAAAGTLPGNLHFAGGDHRTLGFLHRFAALMMISEAQGCPNVSLEAMACGVPVVANDDGGTDEQVIDGVTGRLVPAMPDPALADALADAAAELLADPERRQALGRAAQRHARETFSMAAMAQGYRRVLLPDGAKEDAQ